MIRIGTGIAAALFVTMPVLAHDFWLQPIRFVLAAPASVPMMIYVGHGSARERWAQSNDRVVLFKSSGPEGLVDRKVNLTLDGPRYDAEVPLARAGAYVLAFQSTPSASSLPFLRFNDYARAEGVTPITAYRERTKTDRTDGRELYSRRAKAIIQVGPVNASAIARVTRPVGLSLEIVSERHPLTVKPGEPLPVRVFYNRKPLIGALVKLTDLNADEKTVASMRTDSVGRAAFKIPYKGSWQMNVVWAEVANGNPAADYITTFSSLTFGN